MPRTGKSGRNGRSPWRPRLWLVPLAIILVTAAILGLWYRQTADARTQAFETIVAKIAGQVKAELDSLISPVIQTLERIRLQGREGLISTEDVVALNLIFVPILDTSPDVSAALVADERGREYFLRRDGEGWRTSLTTVGADGGTSRVQQWDSPRHATTRESTRKGDYDPRERPWFKGGVERGLEGTPYWTAPYVFFTSGAPGITGAVAWRDPASERIFVGALDLEFDDLARTLAAIPVADHGIAFLASEDGHVLGLTTRTKEESTDSGLAPVTALARYPQVMKAYETWRSLDASAAPFRVEADSFGAWWASFRPHALGDRYVWIGLVVPEADLLARTGGSEYAVPAAIAGAGVLAGGLSLWFLGRARQAPVSPPPSERATKHDDIVRLIADGESERLEFKSTVRWNLHTNKPGKEIELAWLKTVVAFLNSRGGTVLLGVADDGTILGLEADQLGNDDKCLRFIDNAIDQHVGAEFLPFVSVRLVEMDNRRVVAVDCEPATKPAFLKSAKGEDFYIRSGPGSRKLPTSSVIEYVATHRSD